MSQDHTRCALCVLVFLILGALPVHGGECEPEWTPLGLGTDGTVRALTVFDDGTGPALYAGGSFTTAGGVPANCIARWDGAEWSAVTGPGGTGLDGSVRALAVFDDGSGPALYAGGAFTTADGMTVNKIARWDGSEWSALSGPSGTGVNGIQFGFGPTIYALTVFDDGTGPALYAGGRFTTAGGEGTNAIARWSGSSWSALTVPGSPGLSSAAYPQVYTLTVFDDGTGSALYAGGVIITAGGETVNGIARWDGSFWSPLTGPSGTGVDGGILYELTVFDDGTGPSLYAAGAFITAGGVQVNKIARWDGSSWSALTGPGGTGLSGDAIALTVFDDGTGPALYAGGSFSSAGGVAADRIARWDGSSWFAMTGPGGTGMNGSVVALTVFDEGAGPALYVGGNFIIAGGESASRMARWRCVPPRECPADLNNTGTIDLDDLNLVLTNFGSSNPAGDTDGNGIVDLDDLNAVLTAFGTVCP